MNKITRGISKDFAECFKQSILYKLYTKHPDELFIGVRNDYLNLYYNCDSFAKIEYNKKNNIICCKINNYYLNGVSNSKTNTVDPNRIYNEYDILKKNSNNKPKVNVEKKAQSKLVILNNSNESSNWYCLDIEYKKQFNNKKERDASGFKGRFDIIAISKKVPHRVAIIELKYGSRS